ncbi:MAG: hypothetical protein GXO70_11665 [Acidobacteria bacterium]|nr:hypothetical protein [Acidobacteriota bacterium]
MKWLAAFLIGAALLLTSCGSNETPEAAFLLDEAHQASNRGDYTQAVKLLGQIINQYPGSKEATIASEEYDTFKDLFRYEVEARKQAEVQAVKKVGRAVEIFHQKKRRYPENLDVLIPRYLPARVKDPWDNPIFYKKSRNGYMIACFGKDGVPGGLDENRDIFIQNGQFVSKLILSSK